MATEKKGRRKANPKKESRLEKENYTELNPRPSSESIESDIIQAQIVIQRLQAKYKVSILLNIPILLGMLFYCCSIN